VGKELGANWAGVEAFDLGANNNGAKRKVYFLKFCCQRRICENISKNTKKKEKKKTDCRPCARTPYRSPRALQSPHVVVPMPMRAIPLLAHARLIAAAPI
jgi:hypothetical protein